MVKSTKNDRRTERLFNKWRDWIKNDLLSQFQKIFHLKSIGDAFEATLQPFAGTEPEWCELVEWMAINYVGNMASAIRRLADKRSDVISLRRLLEDAKQNAALITPDNLSKYRGPIGPAGEPVRGSVEWALASDLKSLTTHGESITEFVNKMVAHHGIDAHKIAVPTYGDFRNAIDIFHRIYRKWALFLAGMPCQIDNPNPLELLPDDPPDYGRSSSRCGTPLPSRSHFTGKSWSGNRDGSANYDCGGHFIRCSAGAME